jgi:hypothetical protein
MIKQRRMVSFDPETDQYLSDYMKEHHFRFPGDAIARICKEYEELKNKEENQSLSIKESVSRNIESLLKEELKDIRDEVNRSERNIQYSLTKNLMEMREYFYQKDDKK